MTFVVISIGSNMGNRKLYLENAINDLSKHVEIIKQSSFIDNLAMYLTNQKSFLNAALYVKTLLSPRVLLELCQQIENKHGRIRHIKYGARTLDIDIIFYGKLIVSDPDLIIPHPLWRERSFVTQPIRQMNISVVDPVSGCVV
jgi:dihydroneopterin aldolase/2-amino-4-hydroxy-6-hydroxymethyldihydropteridine diphosphokinase